MSKTVIADYEISYDTTEEYANDVVNINAYELEHTLMMKNLDPVLKKIKFKIEIEI